MDRVDQYSHNLIENNTNLNFITTDQSVINTDAVRKPQFDEVNDFEFFHPLSPHLAIYFSKKRPPGLSQIIDVEEIQALNLIMKDCSHEMIFCANQNDFLKI